MYQEEYDRKHAISASHTIILLEYRRKVKSYIRYE